MIRLPILILFLILICHNGLLAQQQLDTSITNLLAKNGFNKVENKTEKNSSSNYIISNNYTDEVLGLQHVYLQQTYLGITVYNAIKSLVYKDNILQYASGNFITGIAAKVPTATPSLTASAAVSKAATYLQLPSPSNLVEIENTYDANKKIVFSPAGIARGNIVTELVWASNDDWVNIHLAWNISIDVATSPDYWNIRIDAHTGEAISQNNFTVYEGLATTKTVQAKIETPSPALSFNVKQQATGTVAFPPPPTVTTALYNVVPYPYENRFAGSIAVETNPWAKAGINNSATTYGWHFDGTVNYNFTRGNNVFAYDDSLNKNVPGRADTSTTTGATLTFKHTPDFTKQPFTTTNRQFATDNLFYWNNTMHDLFYQYGFTEAAGNFQNDNMGRGGIAGDYIKAEAQDGSGYSNANFSTPSDGGSGRMQMYLYTPVSNLVTINSPAAVAGNYYCKEGNISTKNLLKNVGTKTAAVVYYNDSSTATTTHNACKAPVNNISGKIAFINSAGCSYAVQIKNAQKAGAIGVIVCSVGASLVMTGTDSTINIPAVMVSSTDGAIIAKQLTAGAAVNASLFASAFFDGDLDNGIVTHEYTHGISNRLTGGAKGGCLSNKEQGGEGWSDYVGLMMTTNWATAQLTDGTKIKTHACYAYSQIASGLGNRAYPYTTNMAINPHTYADVAKNSESHFIGEVWCSALWDMTWNIIQQVGSIYPNLYNPKGIGGNTIALQLVITGLKLQPCSPGFLDARNAILAADSILYGGMYKCAIWSAFARRGMGYSAVQGSSNSTNDQVDAYDVPCFTLSGRVVNPNSIAIPNVAVKNTSGTLVQSTTASGSYNFTAYASNANTIRPSKNNDVNKLNGVTVADVSLLQQYLLGMATLTSPYKLIAADADNNGVISLLDMALLKRVVLGRDTTFKGNRRWAFIDSSYSFPNPASPFPYKDSIQFNSLAANKTNQTFIGVKIGDLNYDWNSTILSTPQPTKPIVFYYNNISVSNQAEIHIPIRVRDFSNILAMQYTLNFNSNLLQFKTVASNPLNMDYAANHSDEGNLAFAWANEKGIGQTLPDSTVILDLVFTKLSEINNPEDIAITSTITPIEAYDANYGLHGIVKAEGKVTNNAEGLTVKESWEITPNPNNGTIKINMNLIDSKHIQFQLTSASGQLLLIKKMVAPKGNSNISINLRQQTKLAAGMYCIKAVGIVDGNVKQVVIQ
ncbi:M36 family metallopeptidase [Parasediminibacterium sp. JCM 36343]|uniref:M36 family metallopeptidase n=1 Tax=Parasediminibacterium sp. JCM 36343 TaxID=3374279 RepID=UPI003978F039